MLNAAVVELHALLAADFQESQQAISQLIQ